jgi:hypothetical protein
MDEDELRKEFEFLQHEFPLIKMVTLREYKGRLRCERGPVKELAEKDIWPFTEYIKWHKFVIELDPAHPFKPPIVTWLTEIPHPNIIPGEKGKVCLSILGKSWTPTTKLAAVINGLSFLLSDPNPDSTYPEPECIKAAEVCKKYGFPKRVPKSESVEQPLPPPPPPPSQLSSLSQQPPTGMGETKMFRCPRCQGIFKVVKVYTIQRTSCPFCNAHGLIR